MLHRAGLGLDQSVSGGVLAEVPGGGWPPVLLGSQYTAIGQGLEENFVLNSHKND